MTRPVVDLGPLVHPQGGDGGCPITYTSGVNWRLKVTGVDVLSTCRRDRWSKVKGTWNDRSDLVLVTLNLHFLDGRWTLGTEKGSLGRVGDFFTTGNEEDGRNETEVQFGCSTTQGRRSGFTIV